MNFLQALQVGIGMSNGVLQLVHQVEGPGNGAKKREVVAKLAFASTKTAFEMVNGNLLTQMEKDCLDRGINEVINGVVEFYNQIGVFQKTREITVPLDLQGGQKC